MSAQITVMKFGGTSLEDAQAFQRVSHIVYANLEANPVVVASAMSGVTDALVDSFQRAANGKAAGALQTLEYHFERHLSVAETIGGNARQKMSAIIGDSRKEISELLGEVGVSRQIDAKRQDAITSHGERLSANLLTIVLEGYGIPTTYVDARRCIVTDANHGNVQPVMNDTWRQTRAELLPLLADKKVPVLGGFIAASTNNVTTTLGRGSSDYSATLFSAALSAREAQIWTDVDGVMTADPSLAKSARTVSRLSYEEAAELARLGARVLHSKMIQPVIQRKIPVRILNSRAPECSGTLICAGADIISGSVKAIAHKTKLVEIEVTSTPAFVANGFLGEIRKIFDLHQTELNIVGSTEVGVSLACEATSELSSLCNELQKVGLVRSREERAIISCVGDGLGRLASSEKLRNTLTQINPRLIWQSTSSLNLISMVEADRAGSVVREIHQRLFSSASPVPSEPPS